MRQPVPESNNLCGLPPSRRVRKLFGAMRTAQIAGLTENGVRKWDRPRSKGGLGGLVPAQFQARYLRIAREEGLPLTAEDLIAEAEL
jgi:hypothetical protein